MGTRKRVTLAALVTMMVVLSFVIGFVPARDVMNVRAAGSDEEFDIASLLQSILDSNAAQSGKAVQNVVPSLVEQASTIIAQPGSGSVPLALKATVIGTGDDTIRFVANAASESPWAEDTWTGSVFTDPIGTPFMGDLNMASLVPAAGMEQSVLIYALANTSLASIKQTAFTYETVNSAATAIDLVMAARNLDANGNGYPDNLGDIGPGEAWISGDTGRTIVVANLDDTAKQIGGTLVQAAGDAVVTAPNYDTLNDALPGLGMLNAWLVISATDDLYTLVDTADGSSSGAALQAWADAVNGMVPGNLIADSQYTDVSIVYETASGFAELADELVGTALSVEIAIGGLNMAAGDTPQVWSYPTDLLAPGTNSSLTSVSTDAWSLVDAAPTTDGTTTVTASTQTFSVFAPFDSGLAVIDATPNTMIVGLEEAVSIHGVFPVATALNVAQATYAYQIYVGAGPINEATDAVAYDTNAAVAISAPVSGENDAFVIVPPKSAPGTLNVRVVDLASPANTAETVDVITVLDTFALTTSVSGGTGDETITLSPDRSDPRLSAGTYLAGEVISATLNGVYAGYDFLGWTLNGTNLAAMNPINVTMPAQDSELVALLQAAETFTITTAVAPDAVASTITLTPSSSAGFPEGVYVAGETVTASASLATGFANWVLDGVDAGTDPAGYTFTVTQDHLLVAVYDTAVRLVVTEGQGGSVTVVPDSLSGFYAIGETVTLTPVPETGYSFDQWTGANAADLVPVAGTDDYTLLMDSDKAVTAEFVNVQVVVNSITPDWSWIFGNVVATISGAGLTNDTTIMIGSQEVQGFRAAADGTSVDVVIPSLVSGVSISGTASEEADITVTSADGTATDTLTNGFTYKRYDHSSGVHVAAFVLDSAVATTIGVPLDELAPSVMAELDLPVLSTAKPTDGLVYGIARAADTSTKQNTGRLANLANVPGDGISGITEFDLHLWTMPAVEAAKQTEETPPAGSGYNLEPAAPVAFERLNEDGTPNADIMTLSFPVDTLTVGDVRRGLSVWGVSTTLDYATMVQTDSDPLETELQSFLLNDEVTPNLTGTEVDADEINGVDDARLYTLNSFALRKNAGVDDETSGRIEAANAGLNYEGVQRGGWEIPIVSDFGGLAWVDRVEFIGENGKVAEATAANFLTAPGTDEFNLVLSAPEASEPGVTDVVIYLKADPTAPAATLPGFATYTPTTCNAGWLIFVALLIALLGLASGGDSGGGGGPCFIATAAYGTPLAGDIDALRSVRDTFLLTNPAGTAFVDAYYNVSPAIADAVAKSPLLAAAIRVLLVPVIFLGKVALAMPTLTAFVGLSLGVAFMLRRRSRRA